MDFWDATKVMVRRWYIALPLFLLTLGATAYTAVAVKADYSLTSYVQLVPPTAAQDKTQQSNVPTNPWHQLGLEALSQAANYSTVDQTFLDKLGSEGYSTSFKITVGDPVAGATIEVVAKTRKQAVDTTNAVIKRYQDSAAKLQDQYHVRPQDMITVQRLDQGENLKRPGGKVKRAIIAVFGTGLLLTSGTTIGVDAVFRRRRRNDDWDEPAESIVPNPAGTRNGTRRPPRDFEDQTVRITHDMVRVASSAGAVRSNGEPGSELGVSARPAPVPAVPSDETIMLPLPRTWPRQDKGGYRR